MASIKSSNTLDSEVSQAKNKAASVTELKKIIAAQAAMIAELHAEVSRKELWVNRYAAQLKAARGKCAAPRPSFVDLSARRRAAAVALGAQLGRGATADEVAAYLAAN